jgi:hypothetical protein
MTNRQLAGYREHHEIAALAIQGGAEAVVMREEGFEEEEFIEEALHRQAVDVFQTAVARLALAIAESFLRAGRDRNQDGHGEHSLDDYRAAAQRTRNHVQHYTEKRD